MPLLKNYHYFVSHPWTHSDEYETIRGWLKDAALFRCSDCSIPVDKALDARTKQELKERITSRIRLCNVVIILSGMYVAYREWIQYEIDEAIRMDKPIIGLIPRGQERIPQYVIDSEATMVHWNSDSLIGAIRKVAK